MTPARSTEPMVGASVWASGNHVWNGHIGTLMANPSATAPNATSWNVWLNPPEAPNFANATMSNVCGAGPRKYIARNASSMNTEPNKVYRKNLMLAYSRFAEPQIAMRKYIGTRTNSQKMKNRMRSNAMNVPA